MGEPVRSTREGGEACEKVALEEGQKAGGAQ